MAITGRRPRRRNAAQLEKSGGGKTNAAAEKPAEPREYKQTGTYGGDSQQAAPGAAASAKNGKRGKGGKGKFKKKHIKWIIILAVVLAIAIWVVTCTNNLRKATEGLVSTTEFTTLAYADLRNSISATGVVESADKNRVYSSMSYQVENVLVEVGDYVHEGDVLLELDRASIEKQIHEKELSMEQSEKSGDQSVKSARDTYSSYKEGIEDGTNSSLISANSSVQNAYDNYLKAVRTYEDYDLGLRQGTNSAISAQSSAYSSAREAYTSAKQKYDAAVAAWNAAQPLPDPFNAQTALDNAKTQLETASAAYSAVLANPASTQDQIDKAAAAYKLAQENFDFAQEALASIKGFNLEASKDSAKAALDSAERSLDSAKDSYETATITARNSLREYEIAIDTAYVAYQTALQSRTAAEVAADNQLNAYKNSLETARIAAAGGLAEYQLEEMKKDLEKASITAPVSGTITAVYAVEGATSSGLLFIIEDIERLIVETTVKEYDIGTVGQGMKVAIRSDATGSDSFEGQVTRIAPTANKDAQGNTNTTGDVLFATEVEVTSKNTPLRIGMSVRLEYIVDQVAQVLSVPYDAIYENAAGQTCVLVARPQETGQMLLEELPVTAGMENDLNIAISGDGVEAGLMVINSPQKYTAGQLITPLDMSALPAEAGMMIGPRGVGG